MKLSKIAQICKKHMDITVFRANGAQWFCVGPAAYAAYGLPELTTSEQVLTLQMMVYIGTEPESDEPEEEYEQEELE